MGLLDQFERGIGRQIEEAQKNGKFDNLPGKGKPLKIRQGSGDPALEAAFKILEDNEFSLPWIDRGQQIDRDLAAARHALSLTWILVQENDPDSPWVRQEWARAEGVFRERIAAINKLIRDYNLEIPHLRLERFILNPDAEVQRIREKTIE